MWRFSFIRFLRRNPRIFLAATTILMVPTVAQAQLLDGRPGLAFAGLSAGLSSAGLAGSEGWVWANAGTVRADDSNTARDASRKRAGDLNMREFLKDSQ